MLADLYVISESWNAKTSTRIISTGLKISQKVVLRVRFFAIVFFQRIARICFTPEEEAWEGWEEAEAWTATGITIFGMYSCLVYLSDGSDKYCRTKRRAAKE